MVIQQEITGPGPGRRQGSGEQGSASGQIPKMESPGCSDRLGLGCGETRVPEPYGGWGCHYLQWEMLRKMGGGWGQIRSSVSDNAKLKTPSRHPGKRCC